MPEVKVTWLGHACFELECKEHKIIIDPYKDVRGYRNINAKAHEVICSHEHFDHNYREGVEILPETRSPFTVDVIHSFHDDAGGRLRGTNDINIFTVGRVNKIKIVHFGDIGCELGEDNMMKIGKADCVMIPIGGTYTINAEAANALLKRIAPKVIIPMHYKTQSFGFAELQSIEEFTSLRDDVVFYETNNIILNGKNTSECAVLKYKKYGGKA